MKGKDQDAEFNKFLRSLATKEELKVGLKSLSARIWRLERAADHELDLSISREGINDIERRVKELMGIDNKPKLVSDQFVIVLMKYGYSEGQSQLIANHILTVYGEGAFTDRVKLTIFLDEFSYIGNPYVRKLVLDYWFSNNMI